MLAPMAIMTAAGKAAALQAIEHMKAGGQTNLSAGIELGVAEATRHAAGGGGGGGSGEVV